jgi:hypothetical protein
MDGNTVRRFRTTNLRDYLARFDSLSRAPLSLFFLFFFLYCPDLICSALCHVVINNDDKNRPSGSSPSRTLVVQKGQLESFICVRVTNLSASYSPISFCILYFYLLFIISWSWSISPPASYPPLRLFICFRSLDAAVIAMPCGEISKKTIALLSYFSNIFFLFFYTPLVISFLNK